MFDQTHTRAFSNIFEHCISTILFVSPTTITPKEILEELSAQAKKIHDVCSHCPDEKA